MPGLTACRSYPYPVDADPIDVAGDIKKLADKVDTDTCALFDTTSHIGKWVGGSSPGIQIPVSDQRETSFLAFPFGGTWLVHYTVLLSSVSASPVQGVLRFFLTGSVSAVGMDFYVPVVTISQVSVQVTFPCTIPAGANCQVNFINQGPSAVNAWGDPTNHRFGAHAMLV